MRAVPSLLPQPRQLTLQAGEFSLTDKSLVVLDAADVQVLQFTAIKLQQAIQVHATLDWDLAAGTAIPNTLVGARLSLTPGSARHPQGCQLTINEQGIYAVASEPAWWVRRQCLPPGSNERPIPLVET